MRREGVRGGGVGGGPLAQPQSTGCSVSQTPFE